MRVNLLRAHGSPSHYMYQEKLCRCAVCRGAKAESVRLWRSMNPEKSRENVRHYREANPERVKEAGRRYRADNIERRAEYAAGYGPKWRKKNADKIAEYHRNRRARKCDAVGSHTTADVQSQHMRQRGKCYWCGVQTGESYHIDHVVPLSHGGSNGPENLVIACAPCNLRKNAKHPMDFAGVMC